jgi:hypothetical protein
MTRGQVEQVAGEITAESFAAALVLCTARGTSLGQGRWSDEGEDPRATAMSGAITRGVTRRRATTYDE